MIQRPLQSSSSAQLLHIQQNQQSIFLFLLLSTSTLELLKQATKEQSISISIQMFSILASFPWDLLILKRVVYGTQCLPILTKGEWKYTSISIFQKTILSSISWGSQMRQDTSLCTTKKLSSTHLGQSIVVPVHPTILSSGQCAVKTEHMTIRIGSRLRISDNRNCFQWGLCFLHGLFLNLSFLHTIFCS